ncbi:MAG: hypothetical protein ACI8RD_002063 [Bacillariaceae sp.]|jgi:hypothetical protein
MYRYYLLLSVATSVLCVFSTEAFTTIPSIRYPGGSLSTPSSSSAPSSSLSCTSLNLFPFSRQKNFDINSNKRKKNDALKRRLSDDNDEEEGIIKEVEDFGKPPKRRPKVDDLVQLVSLRMRRVTFLSWWAQMILTVVSSVTLLFTRNVMNLDTASSVAGMASAAATSANRAALLPNYFLAGSSIALSFGSVFWTWATRRLSRRLLRKPTTRIQAANMLRKSITVGVWLNLIGMLLALFGAGQIIGSLAIKVLTTSTGAATVYQQGGVMLLQPLDILVVQANNNTIFSHFCSLAAYLFLGRSISQLDPPSVEGDDRSRA